MKVLNYDDALIHFEYGDLKFMAHVFEYYIDKIYSNGDDPQGSIGDAQSALDMFKGAMR